MINFYDIAYGLAVGLSSPVWLVKPSARKKVLAAFRQRMGQVMPRQSAAPAVMIHAVSLGEINATKGLVDQLRRVRPDVSLIISTTTETGYARASELYGSRPETPDPRPDITLIRYPLDFTSAVTRILDNLRPAVVVLMELEVWPNFLRQCGKRGIPVLVINGRMTEPSFRRYRLMSPLVRGMFRRLSGACVQDQTNAQRFAAVGVAPERIEVTGTMKFDTATVADRIPGDDELAAAVGLQPGREVIWVCGSTGPGEEELILKQYRRLLVETNPHLRLVIVPRHPQRFDEVEELICGSAMNVIRRSEPPSPEDRARMEAYCSPPIVLGDTMGELRKFYSLASVVFVGRSLVDLGPRQHGSDMIEPAALGKPVIVGPYTTNFSEAVRALKDADALREVRGGTELGQVVKATLNDPASAAEMGKRAQRVVVESQGATEKHVQVIVRHLSIRH